MQKLQRLDKSRFNRIAVLLGLFMVFFVPFARTEILDYQDGVISSLSKHRVTLLKGGSDGIMNDYFKFRFGPFVKFENRRLKSIKGLSFGDEVVVGYATENKIKIAKTVLVTKEH